MDEKRKPRAERRKSKQPKRGLTGRGRGRGLILGLGVIVLGYVAWRAYLNYGEVSPDEGTSILLGLVLVLLGVIAAAVILFALFRLMRRRNRDGGVMSHLGDGDDD